MGRHLYREGRPAFRRLGPRAVLNHCEVLLTAEELDGWSPVPGQLNHMYVGAGAVTPPPRGALDGFRVLLLRTPILDLDKREHFSDVPPFALGILAGVLVEHGCRVTVVDLHQLVDNRRGPSEDAVRVLYDKELLAAQVGRGSDGRVEVAMGELLATIPVGGFDLIGLSIGTEGSFDGTRLLAHRLRERYGCPVVLGGMSAPRWRWSPEEGGVDWVISGDGEHGIVRIVTELALGRTPIKTIPGFGAPITRSNVIVDLDLRREPRYDRLDLGAYASRDELTLMYQVSVGCKYHCAWCNTFSNGAFRIRAPELVVSDLRGMVERYGVRRYSFLDNLINLHLPTMRAMASRLAREVPGLAWSNCARLKGMSRDDLVLLRAAGADRFIWGLDTASERLGVLLGKKVDTAEASRILRDAHSLGITNEVDVIVGLPTERQDDFEATVRFIEANRAYIDSVNPQPYHHAHASLLHAWPKDYAPQGMDHAPAPDDATKDRWVEQLDQLGIGKVGLVGRIKELLDWLRR